MIQRETGVELLENISYVGVRKPCRLGVIREASLEKTGWEGRGWRKTSEAVS